MTPYRPGSVQEAQAVATGPTIRASHDQACGWCRDDVAASEPITYTRESGWCHESCTAKSAGEHSL